MVSLFFCWFVSLSFFVYSIVCLAKIYIVCAQWLDISQKFCTNICSKYLHKYLLKIFAQICAQNISLKIAQTVLFFFSSWVILMKQSNQHRNVAKRTTRALVISGHWGAECFFQPMIQMFFQPMIQMFFSQWSKCFFSQWCKCFFSQWSKCFFSQWSKCFFSVNDPNVFFLFPASLAFCIDMWWKGQQLLYLLPSFILPRTEIQKKEKESSDVSENVQDSTRFYKILQESTRLFRRVRECAGQKEGLLFLQPLLTLSAQGFTQYCKRGIVEAKHGLWCHL